MKTGALKKRPNKIIASAILLGIIILLASGCDKHTKYKVLTFFFTGVPSPYDEDSVIGAVEGRTEAYVEKKKVRTVDIYTHGPYAAKKCFFCHKSTESRASFGIGDGTAKKRITLGYIAPPKELCIGCHTQKSPDFIASKNLWLHGPVASGICLVCHDPHKSKYRFLLRVGPVETCTRCHPKESLINKAEHEGPEDCTSCHNPHFGEDRMLLKRDYNEVY